MEWLTSVYGDVSITHNALPDFTGLDNLTSIEGEPLDWSRQC